MAQTHVDHFDASVREADEWLQDVMQETGLDRDRAAAALRSVLQTIRDMTTVRQSSHFVAQMPALIRGWYFEGWEPSRPAAAEHDAQRWLDHVAESVGEGEAISAGIVRGIFRVLERRMPEPAAKIKQLLPRELRALWPTRVAEQSAERRARLSEEERVATFAALHEESGHERGAPLAPHQNRPPGEQHRGGPLPNTM